MRTTHWRAYYLTNPNFWYSLPERARILSAIPAIQLLSVSALCQTGNNDNKSCNFPSYFYQREIQPVKPVSLENTVLEEQ